MRIFIAFVSFIALSVSNAEIAFSNKHHTQHEQSVNAAKQSLQERLSKFDDHNVYSSGLYGNEYGASGSEKHSSSSSSSQRSSSSGHGIDKADYVGVGIVGRSNDAIDSDSHDVQSVVEPSYIGSSSRYSSSNNAFEAEDLQQRQVPADLSSVSSSAYRSSISDKNEDDVQRTVGHGYQPSYGSSRIYSSSRDGSSSHTSGSVVPVYTSGGSTTSHRSSSSQTESEQSETRKPLPTGQYVQMHSRPGVATVVALPIRVVTTNGIPSDHHDYYSRTSENSEGSQTSSQVQHPSSATYRVTYTPSRNYVTSDKISSSSSDTSSTRLGGGGVQQVQQPEKLTTYNSFGVPESASHTKYRGEDSDSYAEGSQQVRVAPVSISYPTNGGTSRTASSSGSSQHGYTQSRVVPVFNYNAIDSASSTRTASEKDERRFTPSAPTYVTSSRTIDSNSGSDQLSSSNYGGSSGSTYIIPSSRSQTQYQSGSGSQTQYQSGTGSGSQIQYQRGHSGSFTPYGSGRTSSSNYGSSGSSSDILSTRYGTGIVNSNTDDLKAYMSEAERLAKLQQQQISGSSSNYAITNSDANRRTLHTASNLDSAAANFVRSSNIANRNSEYDSANLDGSTGGGYNRVRSWNKQSKWASGSEYGSDGKPKSYSHLSTAEAEKYNINGNEAGYKAATTTLENDGKVSTYSIHTP